MCTNEVNPVVLVRSVELEGSLHLSLELRGKAHRLLRSKQESLEKTLKRISLTAAKSEKGKPLKKKKKREESTEEDSSLIEALLYCGEEQVRADTPNNLAWVEGNVLVIGTKKYTVHLNPPTILALKVPNCLMTGYPIVPQVELEFADLSTCSWVWRRCHTSAGTASISSTGDYPVIGSSFLYWPTERDCGHQLLLECIPANKDGRTGVAVSVTSGHVTQGPPSTPITKRHQLTQTHLSRPDQFRMISYNILADPYASSNFARRVLYPYCNPAALDIEYRQCLVTHELLGYHPDVACLQEIDRKTYNNFLHPALHQLGYDGCFSKKSGQRTEGEAILFNTSKFALVSSECITLRKFIQNDPSCSDLYRSLSAAPTVLQDVVSKHTILLIAFLRCLEKPDHYLCIANTHLYFHPLADHIRLIQVEISLRVLKSCVDKFRQTVAQQSNIATLFGGDFNMCPCIAAYSYMVTGSVAKQHPDWMVYRMTEVPRCNCQTKPSVLSLEDGQEDGLEDGQEDGQELDSSNSSDEETVWPRKTRQAPEPDQFQGLDLHHDFHFQNATGITQYTNYTAGYQGVLDYIFIDSDLLEVERVVPAPSHEEVTEFVALPSIHFPSDHLAIVTDLKWK